MNSNYQFYNIKNKKIIGFSSKPLWKSHYLMEAALLFELSKKNSIEYFYCNQVLDSCEANPYGNPDICKACIGWQHEIIHQKIKSSGIKIKPLFNDVIEKHRHLNYDHNSLKSINDLSNIKYYNFDIGKAIINHLVGNFGININLNNTEIQKLLRTLLYSLIDLYEFFNSFFKNENVDYGLTFNGRFPQEAAFLAACEINGVEFIIHERGTTPAKISVYFNQRPHQVWQYSSMALDINLKSYDADGITNIKNFCNNPYKTWSDQVFTGKQIKGSLPIKGYGKVISIFLSTQEEYYAVSGGPEDSSFYVKLEELLNKFSLLDEKADYQVIVRDHPNSAKFSQETSYLSLISKFDFVQYFSPTSEIDTYALIDASEVVITFGSTVGFEALGRGKKVVCLTKWYSIYSVDLPGILVYDVFKDSIDAILEHIGADINSNLIVESAMKIGAAALEFDVSVPSWKYNPIDKTMRFYSS